MKFNNKGQGALEYLLLIGGAVLIAVIVIALLVGMGSSNSENARQQNADAIATTDIPIPSVINSVTCSTAVPATAHYVVNWTPVNKSTYTYTLIADNAADLTATATAGTNPIISTVFGCTTGKTVAIRTTDGTVSVLSSTVAVD